MEFGLPDLEGRAAIFQIHAKTMNAARDIRFELLARLCPNSTGADIRSVCTEAGMFAIRARRKVTIGCFANLTSIRLLQKKIIWMPFKKLLKVIRNSLQHQSTWSIIRVCKYIISLLLMCHLKIYYSLY